MMHSVHMYGNTMILTGDLLGGAGWNSNTAHTMPMVALDRDPIDTREMQYTPHGYRTVDPGEPAMFYGRPPIIPTGTWVRIAHLVPQDIIAVKNDDGSYSDHLRYIARHAGLIGIAVRSSKEMNAFNGTINTPNGICRQNVSVFCSDAAALLPAGMVRVSTVMAGRTCTYGQP